MKIIVTLPREYLRLSRGRIPGDAEEFTVDAHDYVREAFVLANTDLMSFIDRSRGLPMLPSSVLFELGGILLDLIEDEDPAANDSSAPCHFFYSLLPLIDAAFAMRRDDQLADLTGCLSVLSVLPEDVMGRGLVEQMRLRPYEELADLVDFGDSYTRCDGQPSLAEWVDELATLLTRRFREHRSESTHDLQELLSTIKSWGLVERWV